MEHLINIDPDWIIPIERFNISYIENRGENCTGQFKGNFISALKYLYLDDKNGGISTFGKKVKNVILENHLLEPREVMIFKYLFTRTNGSEKYYYGAPAIAAAKKAKYRCEECNNPDVRTLCLDHVWDGNALLGFRMLCCNCHSIKSREEDWKGDKKSRDKKEALKALMRVSNAIL